MQIFEFGAKRPLDPKFGPGGPNHLKTDCLGPGESSRDRYARIYDKNFRVRFSAYLCHVVFFYIRWRSEKHDVETRCNKKKNAVRFSSVFSMV